LALRLAVHVWMPRALELLPSDRMRPCNPVPRILPLLLNIATYEFKLCQIEQLTWRQPQILSAGFWRFKIELSSLPVEVDRSNARHCTRLPHHAISLVVPACVGSILTRLNQQHEDPPCFPSATGSAALALRPRISHQPSEFRNRRYRCSHQDRGMGLVT